MGFTGKIFGNEDLFFYQLFDETILKQIIGGDTKIFDLFPINKLLMLCMFMSCEGLPLQAHDVSSILNHYDTLGSKKLPSKKVQAMIEAKKLGMEDDSLPCPV